MKLIFLSFFILCYCSSFSQETVQSEYNAVPLDSILKDLEKSYEIKFSFNSEIIKDEKITVNDTGLLSAILQKIQSQTSLLFEKVNDRYYVIRKKIKKGRITICGFLYDNISKRPLSEAFINNINKAKSVISDNNGYFQLFLSEPNDTIQVRFLGYKTKQFIAKELENVDCKKIFLSPDDFQLGEVLITEYVTSGISKEQTTGAINIAPDKLGILPRLVEPDVLQTLQFLPGIQSPTETASGIHIRGGTPDHNLILWDGIKMYSTGHFFDLLSIFNPYITENVKLFRSNTEAKYGSRIAGVIDIRSKDEIPNDFGAGLGFNMTNGDVYVEAPLSKDFGILVSGRRSFTDVLETTTFRSYSDRAFQRIGFSLDDEQLSPETIESENIFYFMDFTIKAIANLSDKDKFTASSIFTNNKLDYKLNINNISGASELFNENQKDDLEFVNEGLNLTWDKKYSDSFSHSAQAYFSNYEFDYSGRRETEASSDGFFFFENDITEENKIRDVGAAFHTDWKINAKHSFLSGYEFSTNDVSYTANYSGNNISFNETNHNITHAVYGEYRFNYKNKINVNAGIRGNYFSISDKVFWEPRINLELNLLKNIDTKISFERKNQVISQVSNYLPSDFSIDNQIWLLADSEFVSMLKSDQVSTGIVYNKNDWYIDLEGYYKTTEGLTSFANGFNGVLSLSEGDTEVLGVDLLIKKRFDNYRTWISYSLTDQEFTFQEVDNGNPFPGNFDITHYLSWVHTYQWKNFEFSLGWNIRTGRPFTPASGITETDTAVFINYEATNSKRLRDYHRLDFSTSYKFSLSKNNKWRSKIGFSLFNLYDRENILNRTYNIRVNTDTSGNSFLLQEVNTFSSGITPNISFRIDF
ncbi:TonB-dependent receptor domain-containing protein [Aquimarina sp. 2201CG14-23]|uniref:TonB-dependent receptor domain-containing protein n=1 Tax=Aquimarina mycalae TaxID=3040073 RepID=UPI002478069D|nr:TonB-dependent receptor [Aquimarina sp. 2201CG14-23]MDH7444701.1 TonB-dependent receptor [Aquimarina sp. 2201CG14-23]